MNEPDGATELDVDERAGLRYKHVTTRGQLNQLEQANIQEGLKWLDQKKNLQILDEGFIRQLHKKLFGQVWNWAGTFRQTEKNIGVDPRQISVQLRALLDDVRYWAEHGTYSPREACLRFHHRLVHIHLFPNGNGRHARIMADMVMARVFKGPPIDWAGGHDLQYMNERRQAYIQALRKADERDYSALLQFAGHERDE